MNGKIVVCGGAPLRGSVRVYGAKNSALPILAAVLLTEGVSEIRNCPDLSDVRASVDILGSFGCGVAFRGRTLRVDTGNVRAGKIPDGLMRQMRSSILFLGASLGRFGRAELCAPGGCEIGLRPIDLHLSALREMGVEISERHGRILCRCPHGLHGASVALSFPSVGATENVMIAAAAAKGTTRIFNAAREPEIEDLAAFLAGAGAQIRGAGSSEIEIRGARRLRGCVHSVLPDRIVSGSYLAAAAITGGSVTVLGARADHLRTVLPVLESAGCSLTELSHGIHIEAPPRLKAVGYIRTMPYPGFPTDLQAPVCACMSVAEGVSIVRETVFENRYRHVAALRQLGADVRIEGGCAVIRGVDALTGTDVRCTDLRGGFALVLAGLAAQGKTTLRGTGCIERGYEDVCGELRGLGADIRRIPAGGRDKDKGD